MKHVLKILLLTLLSLALVVPALAENLSFDGQVTAAFTHDIYSDFAGTVDQVSVKAGEQVTADTVTASLRTTRIYAEASGTVVAVMAQPGDSVDAVTQRYGALLYLDDGVAYTVAASCEGNKAYDAVETRRIVPGETVYLRVRGENEVGAGRVTTVDGSSYTVEVTCGAFIAGKTVNIYRDADCTESQRIGQGEITSKAPEGITGSGRVVSVAVQPGDAVQKGDLLLETLEGGTSSAEPSALLLAGAEGVVAEVYVAQGDSMTEGMRIASIWPADAMQIEVLVPEADLGAVHVGQAVDIAFTWNQDEAQPLRGTVTGIAHAADSGSTATAYVATIAFTPDDTVRYGMNVTVSPVN